MRVYCSFYMVQFESITTALKNANIPYEIEEFTVHDDVPAFNALVDESNVELAREVTQKAESDWLIKNKFSSESDIFS